MEGCALLRKEIKGNDMENDKPSFLKNHMDTIAIIGVNLAIAAILVTMWVSNTHRVDSTNARLDTLHVMFYDLLKEKKGG